MMVICEDIIRSKILQKVREPRFLSIIADEATNSANDKQLSFSTRYFDKGVPQEKFLGFNECLSGSSGKAIAYGIITQLTNRQLNPQLLSSKDFDRAGDMAGQ